ncbi:MAG: PQQ-binding-like beta-propeller repeat protein [Acidobacteria bacterium]|nr:PQQ-binding-like beta-propeller repeat protein [Acidobacteriota bacterium]
MRRLPGCALALPAIAAFLVVGTSSAGAQDVEWRSYGSDAAGTKYSPLDQINAETIGDLEIVWRQSVLPDAVRQGSDLTPPVASQNTPLMADGRLYISTALGTVAALDATSGEVLWFDTPPDRDGEPFQRVRQTRGVAYWDDPQSDDARVLAVVGEYLVALDAATGERYPDFGDGGEVDLRLGFDRPVETFR